MQCHVGHQSTFRYPPLQQYVRTQNLLLMLKLYDAFVLITKIEFWYKYCAGL
jgi:hypothetical protein